MATYADFYTSNLFFITQQSVGDEAVLNNGMMVRLLRSALHWVQERQPFQMIGYVFLPSCIHLLIEPTGDTVLDQLMVGMRKRFQIEYGELLVMPGETLLWAPQYKAQRLNDVADFARQLDYIHCQPVQQKLVAQPEAWPYSSFTSWQARGIYGPEWGWAQSAKLSQDGDLGTPPQPSPTKGGSR